MRFDRFMIAPFNEGLVNAVRPWLVPDNAFTQMNNCYVFRQRVKKRFGSAYFHNDPLSSRLRIKVTTIDGAGNANGTVPGGVGAIGQAFSIGSNFFTVNITNGAMLVDGTATSATFNTATGGYVFTGVSAPNGTAVFWYPALPVMGIIQYEKSDINNERTIWFDTKFAYEYQNSSNGFDQVGTSPIFKGTNSQFFWGTTWRGAIGSERFLFITNNDIANVATIGMYYLDNTTWNAFKPKTRTAANNFILTARMVVVFKNRLVFLNTTQLVDNVQQTFVNRAYYGQFGDPTDTNAFNADIPGKGNSIDAATSEAIVTCEFLKDRLYVHFERSTWELVYTGNQNQPFTWQKINTELGAESTFSSVPFDNAILTVGNVGIHATSGQNVQRIDTKIPQEVFKVHNANDGIFRVYGIRDYFAEQVYWTFPSLTANVYPDKVLVYNYELGTWAFNDDTITAFGYFQPQTGVTWDDKEASWDDDISWDSGALQTQFRQVVAGNQEGFVFIIDADGGSQNTSRNSGNLQITDMTTGGVLTVIDHNLIQDDYVMVEFAAGITELNDKIFRIQSVDTVANTITLDLRGILPTGTYAGSGTLATVSRIDLYTKQYNFYAQEGKNAYVTKVDFLVDRVDGSPNTNVVVSVDYFASSSDQGLTGQAAVSGALLGNGTLDLSAYALFPQELNQERLWHPVYISAEGEVVQLRIYYNDAQMIEPLISQAPFQLHSFCLYVTPVSGYLQ